MRGGRRTAAPFVSGATAAFSSATGQVLNSGIRDVGSSASLTSAFTHAAPPQWNGTNTVSRRMPGSRRASSTALPRGVDSRTGSPSAIPCTRASSGCSSTYGRGTAAASVGLRRVWVPDWYCARDRPVVSRYGWSASGSSPATRGRTARKFARPSGVAKRSANSRGVPGWSSAGHGQCSASPAASRS